jgi:hypothetical protein
MSPIVKCVTSSKKQNVKREFGLIDRYKTDECKKKRFKSCYLDLKLISIGSLFQDRTDASFRILNFEETLALKCIT